MAVSFGRDFLLSPSGHASLFPPSLRAQGQMHHGWVRDVTSDAGWVCLSFRVTGRVEALEASDDLKVVAKLKRHFAPGDAVRVRVVAASKSADGAMRLDLSLRGARRRARHAGIQEGQERRSRHGGGESGSAGRRHGRARPRPSRAPGRGLDVLLSGNLHGRAPITEICDDWVQEPLSTFEPQQYTKAVVLTEPAADGGFVDVSLRRGAIAAAASSGGKTDSARRAAAAEEVEVGELVRVRQGHLGARLLHLHPRRRRLRRIAPSRRLYRRERPAQAAAWDTRRRPRPAAGGKGGGGGGGALPMSLKRSEVEGGVYVKPPITLRYEDVTPGMVLDGAIKSVQDFGVFVRLDGSEVDALCHSSEVSDKRVGSLKAAFKPGERVKVVVLRKNEEKGQLSASMKRSRLEEFGWDEDEEAEAKAKAGKAKGADVDEEEEDDEEDEEDDEDDDEMDDDEMDDDEMDDDDDDEEDEEDEEEDDDDGSLIEEDEDEDMLDDDDDDDDEEEEEEDDDDDNDGVYEGDALAAIAASGGGSRAKLGS